MKRFKSVDIKAIKYESLTSVPTTTGGALHRLAALIASKSREGNGRKVFRFPDLVQLVVRQGHTD